MKQFLLYLLVLSSVVARAQKNYVPAVIISQQNDSLRGFIDYRNWRINPEQISFKQDLQGHEQRFSAGDIAGFLVTAENELYVSRQVELDVTVQTIDNLLATGERVTRNDTVFLLTIVKGAYNLYLFNDRNDQPHFVYDSAGVPAKELRLVKSRASDGSNAIATFPLYQRQLSYLFAACPEVARKAADVRYSEDALRKLFTDYHQCRNPSEKIAVKAKEKLNVRWGLLAGTGFNSFNFSGSHSMTRASYKSNTTPLAGLFIDVPVSRNRQQYWLSAEAFYKTESASGTFTNANILESWQEQVSMKFSYAQLNLLFRYLYPKGTVKPFANVGWGNGVMIGENKNEKYRTDRKDDVEKAINGPRKHETTFLAGGGVQYKRIQIEGRYAWSNGFSPYISLNTSVRSLQVIARFAL
ncbi:hypothetical protein [uncultured Chitinophaga sp.]|uniref:hypothetical protein n=1 Tax=uncultured Chitinophaga sp. TaxID=339340 RepID=UPI0026388D75|nr:hypothetical protein [uncultured Chitinophaga sp.]